MKNGNFPLSSAQHEIYIGQQLDPLSPLYNMGMLFEIRGALDSRTFVEAWDKTVECFDALNIRLHLQKGEIRQCVESRSIPTTMLDYSGKPHAEADAREWVQKNLEQPVSLFEQLVESTLIKISSDHWMWYCKQHHIVTDATSFTTIWHQIKHHYDHAVSSTQPASASPTEGQATFLEYVAHPANDTRSENDPNQIRQLALKKYWGSKTVPPSPTLYGRRPSYTSTEAQRAANILASSKAEQLEQLITEKDIRSISSNLARFQVLLTVLFAYLYRVSGQSSIAVATTSPNRTEKRFSTTPGLFVELLPLTIDFDPGETFSTLHQKVKAEAMGFMKNATPGASTWVSSRGVSAVLNFVPLNIEPLHATSVNTEWLHAGHMDRQHALRLHAMDWDNSGRMSLAFDTNDSCFNDNEKINAQQHWLALFDAFANDRSQSISSVDILSNEIQHATSCDQTPLNTHAVGESLIARFDRIASTHSASSAVFDGDSVVSYSELARRVDALSSRIRKLTVGRSKNVAVLLPRSIAVPVALLSALKSGVTYIPIEPNNPPERVRQLLELCGADLLISNKQLAEKLTAGTDILCIDEHGIDISQTDQTAYEEFAENDVTSQAASDDTPAYILYTSGSTGEPKGVVISRAAMMNYCAWAVDYYTDDKPLHFPFFTPLGFDLTVTSLFVPLLSGGAIHVYRSDSETFDNSLFSVIKDNKVDIIKLTPAHLAMIEPNDVAGSKITQMIVGGEDLNASLAHKISMAFNGQLRIHNEYGPTEATVGCIVHQYEPETDVIGSVPIGLPVAGMQALVLNEAEQQQPAGVAGMLYLTGPSLANGYFENPEQTDSVFRSLNQSKHRFYCTGDIVRCDENGKFTYLGREDDQLKIRGARIELAEIESVALQTTAIKSCIATAVIQDSNVVATDEQFCERCGLSSHYPEATFNTENVCSLCTAFEKYESKAQMYFKTLPELENTANKLRSSNSPHYDCMMLLSGGKDSTYALAQLVDMGLSVLAYTLDNGYLSTDAKTNIKKVCDALDVDHEFGETPDMRKIFALSLEKYSNVCNGCFKTIYTLSMKRAQELKIPAIFTGLSRGQFFETRLTEELFSDPNISIEDIDATVLNARKAYHRTNDAISRLLNTEHFQSDDIFNEVQVYDFYRYSQVSLDDMLHYLQSRLPWVRPSDTGRSTNCLINDVGIHVHKIERGFHNYSLPYSWDVRLAHKNKDAAKEELNDEIDVPAVEAILDEIGYNALKINQQSDTQLALYFTADELLDTEELPKQLATVLPSWMLPKSFVQLDAMPLSKNGKVDKSALPLPGKQRATEMAQYVAPSSDIEKLLVNIWAEQLKIDKIGVHDNFFELGGDSLSAIKIASKISERGLTFSGSDLFEHQTIAQISLRCAQRSDSHSNEPQATIEDSAKPFSSLSSDQMAKLSKVLNKAAKPEAKKL